MVRVSFLGEIIAIPFLFFLLNIVFLLLGWYESFLPLDNLMHFSAGFIIARSGKVMIDGFRSDYELKNVWLQSAYLTGFVFSVAVLWELSEFLIDFFLGTNLQLGSMDTLLDLLLGTSGGILFTIAVLLQENRT